MILNIVVAVVALVIGGLAGYFIFRYVITGKYKGMISAAEKEADVEKRLWKVFNEFNRLSIILYFCQTTLIKTKHGTDERV